MIVLVTGAAGMVGSHLLEYLYKKNIKAIGTYYNPKVNIEEITQYAKLIECDIRYQDKIYKILEKYKPKVIYHLAAQSLPALSWIKPHETLDINVLGTVALFESIKKIRLVFAGYDPVVVVACSSAEYGNTLNAIDHDVTENDSLQPLHPYGVSKVAQDQLAYQYFINDNIKVIRARIFNTTGPRKINDVTSDFIRRTVELERTESVKKILTVGNLNTYRAILDVNDLISALVLLVEKGKFGEAYNICSTKVYRVGDIVKIIAKYVDFSFSVKIDKSLLRSSDEKIIKGNSLKLINDTGWIQRVDLEDTIKEMLNYWRNK